MTCKVDGCNRAPHASNGFCSTHERRFKKHGDPQADKPIVGSTGDERCQVTGCDLPYYVKGFCKRHYDRFNRHGDPLVEKRNWIPAARVAAANGDTDAQYRLWRRDREQHLKKKYRISVDEYDRMYDAQNGRCAICSDERERCGPGGDGSGTLVVDHDHATGSVRKLLCAFCNRGLGYFRDNPQALRSAADYLDA